MIQSRTDQHQQQTDKSHRGLTDEPFDQQLLKRRLRPVGTTEHHSDLQNQEHHQRETQPAQHRGETQRG